jgi:hypothetical protein
MTAMIKQKIQAYSGNQRKARYIIYRGSESLELMR